VSRDLLPEQSAGPEGCFPPKTPANRPLRPRVPHAAQAPTTTAGLITTVEDPEAIRAILALRVARVGRAGHRRALSANMNESVPCKVRQRSR